MPAKIIIEEVRTPEALRKAQAIREQIFVVEQGIPRELEQDGLDAASIHVLALYDGAPAATGRLTMTSDREGVLARIAVLPDYRGKGLGKHVVQHLEALARREGLATVSLKPHHYLEDFYQKMGYTTVPGSFSTAGPHPLLTMTKPLS